MRVFDHFKSSFLIPDAAASFSEEMIRSFADDRALLMKLSDFTDEYHELDSLSTVTLFRTYCEIISAEKSVTVLTRLEGLVNKPEQQEILSSYLRTYAVKYQDMTCFIAAFTRLSMTGNGIAYSTDIPGAARAFFGCTDREKTMKENENLLKSYDRLRTLRDSFAPKKHWLFGKK